MLSAERGARTSREDFEDALPPKLHESTGIRINSISRSLGAESCLDGWLDGVEGYSGYAFELIEEGDSERISDWRAGGCNHRQ